MRSCGMPSRQPSSAPVRLMVTGADGEDAVGQRVAEHRDLDDARTVEMCTSPWTTGVRPDGCRSLARSKSRGRTRCTCAACLSA